MSIVVLDTSVGSENLGDYIIMDAVNDVLSDIFTHSHLIAAPTHQVLSRQALKRLSKHDFCFIGGSNLLTAKRKIHRSKNSWRAGIMDAFYFQNKGVVIGAGCEKSDNEPNSLAKYFYSQILSKDYLHSVRDQAGMDVLKKSGLDNVINTACPTMWKLKPEHCESIVTNKSSDVVFTLTDYHQAKDQDKLFILKLLSSYNKVYFWPQGSHDLSYLRTIGLTSEQLSSIVLLKTNLAAYDYLLKNNESLDYVGTRV